MAGYSVFICVIFLLFGAAQCDTTTRAPCKYADQCGKNTTCNALGCFCNVAGVSQRCEKGDEGLKKDCDHVRGCTCLDIACKCGDDTNYEYCDSPELCDKPSGKCKCGLTGKLCADGEKCELGACFCDTVNHIVCSEYETCVNGNCLCGDKKCDRTETCNTKNKKIQPFCSCGDMWRRCTTHETCEVNSDSAYECKCGNTICRYDERCEVVAGEKKCMCGDKACNDLEICVQTANGKESSCLCPSNCDSSHCGSADTTSSPCTDEENDCKNYTEYCFMTGDDLAKDVRQLCPATCKTCPELKQDSKQGCNKATDCGSYENAQYCAGTCAVSD